MDAPEAARRGPDRRLCDDLARGLGAEPTVRLAWLFGSRARGAARRDSDVDVAVLVGDACTAGPGAAKDTMFRVIGALGRFVRSDRVDLVLLDHAPPLLRHRVIRDGVLLYARSDAERARFVRRRLREYLDLEPRLREQNRLRLRRLREGRPRPPSPCGTNTPMPGPWPRAPGDRSGPGARAVGSVDGFTPGRTALRSGRESAGSGRPW